MCTAILTYAYVKIASLVKCLPFLHKTKSANTPIGRYSLYEAVLLSAKSTAAFRGHLEVIKQRTLKHLVI